MTQILLSYPIFVVSIHLLHWDIGKKLCRFTLSAFVNIEVQLYKQPSAFQHASTLDVIMYQNPALALANMVFHFHGHCIENAKQYPP